MDKCVFKRWAAALTAVCTLLTCAFFCSNRISGDSYYYGDLNGDSRVNKSDLKLLGELLSGRTKKVTNFWAGDINDDDKVNVYDYIFMKRMLTYGIFPGEPVPGTVQPSQPVTEPDTGDTAKAYAEEVLRLVNIEREKVGEAPLKLNDALCEAAAVRAREIAEKFSHDRPDGRSCFTVLDDNGIRYHYVGENIAAGKSTPAGTMDQWVNSAGHYANIIKSEFTELGVGYVYVRGSEYKYYWVQLFRQP